MTTKPISRKSGRSATASSAYRNACKMIDERTGVEHDYTKKMGVVYSECFDKDNNELDRSELWNKAELVENRKDARTAREYIIAIPSELMPDYPEPIPDLTEEEKKDSVKVAEHKLKVKQYRIESEQAINDAKSFCGIDTARDFAKALAEKYEVAVDIAIHAPDSQGNNKNWHAHIMTTTRKVELTKDGVSLTDKADIELSNKKLFELNKPKNQEQVKEVREMWADTANRYLSDELKIDHRSYADQGKDQLPTVKLGWKASALERKGIKTDRGDINRDIKSDNERIAELKSEIYLDKGRLSARNKKDEIKEQHEQELREQIEQRRRQQQEKEPSKERPLTLLEKRELWKQKQAQQQQKTETKTPEPETPKATSTSRTSRGFSR